MFRSFCFIALVLFCADLGRAAVVVSGERMQFHPITLTFEGPEASENGELNPFRDYRLQVFFFQIGSEDRIAVPGYFAADGKAAETGATKGNKWRVHFTPPKPGRWMYGVSFRTGRDIALNPDPKAGRTLSPDAEAGRFDVTPTDKKGPDFRGRGFLRYVKKRYLQFDSGGWFLKGGADSPENFLAFEGFDGTRKGSGKTHKGEAKGKRLHHYEPHVRDWRKGDPTWRGGRGKGIVGAVNYLADQKMNSIYFLTMNVGGDGKDVWPWTDEKVRDRFDCC